MTTSERSSVVLVSGGMDSVTALYEAAAQGPVVAALSFDYGAKHHERELPMARWHADKLGIRHVIIRLPFLVEHFESALLQGGAEIPKGHYEEESMKQTVVPFRNGILLAIAAGFAESNQAAGLVIAAHAGDHAIYPDCREGFMLSMAEAIRLGTYAEVNLLRPFIGLSKGQIASKGAALGVDFAQTWSCYVGGEQHCGECGTCVERREAFLEACLVDPTAYVRTGPLPARPSR
jgi:7-cyano-7-deazaguanine synthase